MKRDVGIKYLILSNKIDVTQYDAEMVYQDQNSRMGGKVFILQQVMVVSTLNHVRFLKSTKRST